MSNFYILQTLKDGSKCVVSGLGKNKGTWDSLHSRSRAYYWLKWCRKWNIHSKFEVSLIDY